MQGDATLGLGADGSAVLSVDLVHLSPEGPRGMDTLLRARHFCFLSFLFFYLLLAVTKRGLFEGELLVLQSDNRLFVRALLAK